MDITEIEGFDDLHQPEGILKEAQERAARLYGAEESFYLVGGSTCGILAAISAAVPENGHILMARNCHRSSYHAAYLRHLSISYLYPGTVEGFGICEAVTAAQVEEALSGPEGKDVDAVLIVSPTYEGRIAEVARIAEVVHRRHLPLIVDEAHGAHLGLVRGIAPNSCQAGADLVVHSAHKTLPAMTQTALLHVNGSFIDRSRLRRFLKIYQSSSPSYVLMASLEDALRQVEERGEELYGVFYRNYGRMLGQLECCGKLKILAGDGARQDVGKLVISVRGTGLSGRELYDILYGQFHLQLEMAAQDYVLAMFTIGDTPEGFQRMTEALLWVDAALERGELPAHRTSSPENSGDVKWPEHVQGNATQSACMTENKTQSECLTGNQGQSECMTGNRTQSEGMDMSTEAEGAWPLWRAWDAPAEPVPLSKCGGRIAAEFVNLYPPGTPLLVPGERIDAALPGRIASLKRQGLKVQGLTAGDREDCLRVII